MSVDLPNFVRVMKDVREGVLSRWKVLKKFRGNAVKNVVISPIASVTLKLIR